MNYKQLPPTSPCRVQVWTVEMVKGIEVEKRVGINYYYIEREEWWLRLYCT